MCTSDPTALPRPLARDRPDEARRHWEHVLEILTAHGIDRSEDKRVTTATSRALTWIGSPGTGRRSSPLRSPKRSTSRHLSAAVARPAAPQ
jgi:hypothetical protein